jgi:hypothetical protein
MKTITKKELLEKAMKVAKDAGYKIINESKNDIVARLEIISNLALREIINSAVR